MKYFLIISFVILTQLSFGQTCDTIEGRTVNCIDENGLKQGNWEYWKYEWRQEEYTGEVAGYCQTKPLTKVPIKLLKKGKFKDDKKVGKWEFIDDGGDYISTTRTEQYLDDGSVEVEESGFQSVYNHDSSIVKSIVLSGKDTIYINCEQKQCIGTYRSQQLVSASLSELETEIDKIRWGSYAREIRILKLFKQGKCHFDSIHFDGKTILIKYDTDKCSTEKYNFQSGKDSSVFFNYDGVKCFFNPKQPFTIDKELIAYFKKRFVLPKKWKTIPHIVVVAIMENSKGKTVNYGLSKKTQDSNYDEKINEVIKSFDYKSISNEQVAEKEYYTLKLHPIDLDEFR